MKPLFCFLLCILLIGSLCACDSAPQADIAATTLPVYEFTTRLCQGTDLTVTRLVAESVSCLHDYTLKTGQLKAIQGAKALVISGAGLEEFLEDALAGANHVIDASKGVHIHESHDHEEHEGHHHDMDPHIWLSPLCAMDMAKNICQGLCETFPQHKDVFHSNLTTLLEDLEVLQQYGEDTLKELSCRKLITFHDGFSYLAENYGLTILEAVEEESGSEASSKQLIHLCNLVRDHRLPAVFTEVSGSTSAASVISRETGVSVFALDMAMAGDSYFTSMYHNIDTIKEALG